MDSGDAAGVTRRLPIALTIAGSDSGGGAGIQADLKTFAAFGVYAASVVTALTAQNTRGVRAIHTPPPGIVGAQIEAVLEDFAVAAIKIGMLGSAEIANVVAARLPSSHSPSRDGRPPERPLERGVGGEGARAAGPGPHPADYVGHLLPAGEGVFCCDARPSFSPWEKVSPKATDEGWPDRARKLSAAKPITPSRR